MVEEEENQFVEYGREEGKKEERKEGSKKEEKKEEKEEVAYTPRGRVLLLLWMPLSRGHSMAMELCPNIRVGSKHFGTNCVGSGFVLLKKKLSFGAG